MSRLDRAVILAVGSELTAGRVVDTNSAELSAELRRMGIDVLYHFACPDDMEVMVDSLALARQRAPLVLVTGGLGPTSDDFTRDAIARFVDRPLERDEACFSALLDFFKRLGRDMPARNEQQVWFPKGATVLPNAAGTAPGFFCEDRERVPGAGPGLIFAFPGVPREVRVIWQNEAKKRINERSEQQRIAEAEFRVCGVAESNLNDRLEGVEGVEAGGVEIAYAVKEDEGVIAITLTARGEMAAGRVETARSLAEQRCKNLICARGTKTLPETLADLLSSRGMTLRMVEGPSAGRMTTLMAAKSESYECLRSSLTLPDRKAQLEFLGRDEWSGSEAELAQALARKVYENDPKSLVLVTVDASNASESKVQVALQGPGIERCESLDNRLGRLAGRTRVLTILAASALNLARRALEAEPGV